METNGFPDITWICICQPLKEGGLGLRYALDLNHAGLAKLLWQVLMNKESLSVKRIHGVYIGYGVCGLSFIILVLMSDTISYVLGREFVSG